MAEIVVFKDQTVVALAAAEKEMELMGEMAVTVR
jgi:hypothetical protein